MKLGFGKIFGKGEELKVMKKVAGPLREWIVAPGVPAR